MPVHLCSLPSRGQDLIFDILAGFPLLRVWKDEEYGNWLSIQTSRLRHNQYQTRSVILFESEKRVDLVGILEYHTIMEKL